MRAVLVKARGQAHRIGKVQPHDPDRVVAQRALAQADCSGIVGALQNIQRKFVDPFRIQCEQQRSG